MTDDGFGFFNSTPGPNPWVNQILPDPADPNDLLAPLWADWVVNYDNGSVSGDIRGITAATAGPDLSIIEWDGVEYFPGDGSNPIAADFQVIMFSTVDPDFPEFIFAYQDIDEGFIDLLQSIGFVTIGAESGTGTSATDYFGAVTDDLLLCLDYEGPDTSPKELSFTATPSAFWNGRTAAAFEWNEVDNPGSRREYSWLSLEFEQLPYDFRGFIGLYDGKQIRLNRNRLNISFQLFDPVFFWRSIRDAEATVEITDSAGNVVASGDAHYNHRRQKYTYRWRIRNQGLEAGDYTITAYLDDGTSHSVTVELVH